MTDLLQAVIYFILMTTLCTTHNHPALLTVSVTWSQLWSKNIKWKIPERNSSLFKLHAFLKKKKKNHGGILCCPASSHASVLHVHNLYGAPNGHLVAFLIDRSITQVLCWSTTYFTLSKARSTRSDVGNSDEMEMLWSGLNQWLMEVRAMVF